MDIVEVVKSYSKKVIKSDDLKDFHFWIINKDGPLYYNLNPCCVDGKCIGRTWSIGNLTFKSQGHRMYSLSAKFRDADDSTYVVLNTESDY